MSDRPRCGQCSAILDANYYCRPCRADMPTAAEIRRRCAEIQSTWTPQERAKRAAFRNSEWTPLLINFTELNWE